jgi:hypothetical protein
MGQNSTKQSQERANKNHRMHNGHMVNAMTALQFATP